MSKKLNLNYLVHNMWRRILPGYLSFDRGTAVLECGLGVGKLMSLMEKWFPNSALFGLDIDFDAISAARRVINRAGLVVAAAESLPFPDQSFDLLISLHVIEHLPQPERFLGEARRLLRPEGILAVATPNPAGWPARLMGSRWSGWHAEHISLHPPGKWRAILEAQGFVVLREGTTGLSSIPLVRMFPFCLFNWGLLFLFGFFSWRHGNAYISICALRIT